MSDQEDSGRHKTIEESVVVMNQHATVDSKAKSYRPTELENDSLERHKWSKTPVVPSVADKFKDGAPNKSTVLADTKQDGKPGRKNKDHTSKMSEHQVSKLLSDSSHAPVEIKATETVVLSTMSKDPVLKVIPSQATPVDVGLKSVGSGTTEKTDNQAEVDSITEEIAEIPTIANIPDWSDEQEAGGLPRSSSRSSRVSRVLRNFLCCSSVYSPASEEDISTPRIGTGI